MIKMKHENEKRNKERSRSIILAVKKKVKHQTCTRKTNGNIKTKPKINK